MAEEYGVGGPERILGSSFDSFADAARNALASNPPTTPHRMLEVVRMVVEEGGVVGRTQFTVELIDVAQQPTL